MTTTFDPTAAPNLDWLNELDDPKFRKTCRKMMQLNMATQTAVQAAAAEFTALHLANCERERIAASWANQSEASQSTAAALLKFSTTWATEDFPQQLIH